MKSAPPPAAILSDPLQNMVGYQLRRVSLAMAADLAARLEDLNLTVLGLSVLLMIEANPGVTQSDLGRSLGVKRANMAPLTAQLVERDLIVRKPTDGRSHGLDLTEAGRTLTRAAWPSVGASETHCLSSLGPPARAQLVEIIADLRKAVPRSDP